MSNSNITNVGKRIQEAEVVPWSVLFFDCGPRDLNLTSKSVDFGAQLHWAMATFSMSTIFW